MKDIIHLYDSSDTMDIGNSNFIWHNEKTLETELYELNILEDKIIELIESPTHKSYSIHINFNKKNISTVTKILTDNKLTNNLRININSEDTQITNKYIEEIQDDLFMKIEPNILIPGMNTRIGFVANYQPEIFLPIYEDVNNVVKEIKDTYDLKSLLKMVSYKNPELESRVIKDVIATTLVFSVCKIYEINFIPRNEDGTVNMNLSASVVNKNDIINDLFIAIKESKNSAIRDSILSAANSLLRKIIYTYGVLSGVSLSEQTTFSTQLLNMIVEIVNLSH